MHIQLHRDISAEEWKRLVDHHPNLMSIHELEGLEKEVYGYAVLRIGNTNYGGVYPDYDQRRLLLNIRLRELPLTYRAVLKLSEAIGGIFYYRKNEPFDPQKHLPAPAITIDRAKPYFADSELEELRWMALRSTSQEAVLETLRLSKQREGRLEGLLREEGYVLSPAYEGWVFIMGDTLPELLLRGDEQSSQEALERLCKSLQQQSKTFGAAQYFEYSGKSSVSGYFSASNGKLIYGYWQSELETFSKGRPPKAIKHLHPANPHEIAALWSIDPLDFVYLAPFAEEGAVLAGRGGAEPQ
jgi:hypothetical protein